MTTGRGEISPGTPGRLNDQLSGRVWFGQNRGQWPIAVMTSESQVVTWMSQNPNGVVWEYEATPIRRVGLVRPEPHLSEYRPDVAEAAPDGNTQRLERVQR